MLLREEAANKAHCFWSDKPMDGGTDSMLFMFCIAVSASASEA